MFLIDRPAAIERRMRRNEAETHLPATEMFRRIVAHAFRQIAVVDDLSAMDRLFFFVNRIGLLINLLTFVPDVSGRGIGRYFDQIKSIDPAKVKCSFYLEKRSCSGLSMRGAHILTSIYL